MSGSEPVELVRAAVESGLVPGAVLMTGVGADGPPTYAYAGGVTAYGPGGRPVTADTVFDLASLTKVVATTPCVLRLAEQGRLGLDDPVQKHLPGFAGTGRGGGEGGDEGAGDNGGEDDAAREQVTIRHLLTHSSGLPAHRLLYELPGTPADRFRAAQRVPLDAVPGSVVCYSDIGFILLGEIVRAVTGTPLDQAFDELVAVPLGLTSTRYLPPESWRDRIAATEAPPGGEPKVGIVHDENAESLGGVAGHAGLFGTAPDLVSYLAAGWLATGDGPLLSAATRRDALRSHTPEIGGVRGLGWTLRGDRWDHMSDLWPATGAGHTGFTGTSLAFDAPTGLWTVLLTNVVHPSRVPNSVVALRRQLHAAVVTHAATERP